MGVPDLGNNAPHQFVYESAGEARWRELLGVYLPKPRWRVRVATFSGDANETAEEWQIFITADGEVRNVRHIFPQARPGASLDEDAARTRALAAVKDRFALGQDQLKEISAKPAKQQARMDWTFTYKDAASAGRGTHRRRARGRRTGISRPIHLRPGGLAASAARGIDAQPDYPDCYVDRVRRTAAHRRDWRDDRVEPA